MKVRMVAALGFATVIASGCTSTIMGDGLPTEQSPASSGQSATVANENQDTPENAMQYLRSDERAATYKDIFYPLAEQLAYALEDGALGMPERFDAGFRVLPDNTDYTGKGMIYASQDSPNLAYVHVYFQDGAVLIDEEHPIMGAGTDIDLPVDEPAVNITTNETGCTPEMECYENWHPWPVAVAAEPGSQLLRVSIPDFVGESEFPGNDSEIYPLTMEELKALDQEALDIFRRTVEEILSD